MKCYCLIKKDVIDLGYDMYSTFTVIAVYMDSAKAKEKADELNCKEREELERDYDPYFDDNDRSGTDYFVSEVDLI